MTAIDDIAAYLASLETGGSSIGQIIFDELTPVVRCRDCANAVECEDGTLDCHGARVQTWDYYNDEPLRNPVPPNGFCAWGVRRAES